MNNMPFMYPPIMNNNYYFNLQKELIEIKNRLKALEDYIREQENKKENSYLKKDDNYYMI